MVADAILLPVGEVGVAGAEHLAQVLVVVGVLIGIAYQEADGLPRRLSLEHAAKQFHLVGLLPGCGQSALARAASVQFTLNKIQVHTDASRHTVDDTTDAGPVTLTKRSQAEYMTETITHGSDRNRSGRHVRGDVRRHSPRSPHSHSRNRLHP